MPQNRRGVRIFSEGLGVAVGEYFHEPVVEIIHGMVVNRAEAAIIFLAGLIQIAAQSAANVFLLAGEANVLRPEQLDVLHRDFGHAVGAPVQVLHFGGQAGDIERLGGGDSGFFDVGLGERLRFMSSWMLRNRRVRHSFGGRFWQDFLRFLNPFDFRLGGRGVGGNRRGRFFHRDATRCVRGLRFVGKLVFARAKGHGNEV